MACLTTRDFSPKWLTFYTNELKKIFNEDERLHPVSPKCVALISKAKNAPAKPSHLKDSHKDTSMAPELVDGSGKPSVKSDIYALAFFINTVYRLLKYRSVVAVKNAFVASPEERPTIRELKVALSAEI